MIAALKKWWLDRQEAKKTCANGWHRIVCDGWDPYHVYVCYKCRDCTWRDMRSLHELIPGVPTEGYL